MLPEKDKRRNEDEYFLRQELEKKKKWAEEQKAKMAAEERDRLKELHHMRCPKCGMELTEIHLHGIHVDRCTSCNGTWFDEGEIERLVEDKNSGLFGRVMGIFK